MTGYLSHPELGPVKVTFRANSRSITARWRNDEVCLSVPVTATVESIRRALDSMAPRLLVKRPACASLAIGSRLEMPGLVIEVRRGTRFPDRVTAQPRRPLTVVEVGERVAADAGGVTKSLRGILPKIAARLAPEMLLPRLRELADRHLPAGKTVASAGTFNGRRLLGRCYRDGRIELSCQLIFMPLELRDYVMRHELAHLSHHDHSPAFHDLCNRYCGGRERELEKMLRAFAWPF